MQCNTNFLLALQSGDSGAWVVDKDTSEVYGHVIASDVFGRGYIIPVCDLFEDIKNRFSAEAGSLPSKDDILTFNQHHYHLEPTLTSIYQLSQPLVIKGKSPRSAIVNSRGSKSDPTMELIAQQLSKSWSRGNVESEGRSNSKVISKSSNKGSSKLRSVTAWKCCQCGTGGK